MEKKLIPAPIDGKAIVSDFINDFMNSCDEYRNGHIHAIIGTPLETNKPYICEYSDRDNWLRFRPVDTLVNDNHYTRYADNKRLADEFCKEHDERLVVTKDVYSQGVVVNLYFTND